MSFPAYFEQAVRDCVGRYPLLHDPQTAPVAYGTAGFRTMGTFLPPVAARVGFVAALRVWWAAHQRGAGASPADASGCAVGCMITASHNPAVDNGLKLVDVDGGMLSVQWEAVCTAAANSPSAEALLHVLSDWKTTQRIEVPTESLLMSVCPYGAVQIARDTRPSGVNILHAVQSTLSALKVSVADHGIIPTPQLHYMVYCANTPGKVKTMSPGATEFGPMLYYHDILHATALLLESVGQPLPPNTASRKRQRIVVDASNGVGALGLHALLQYARSANTVPTPASLSTATSIPSAHPLETFFEFVFLHEDVSQADALNFNCGADFTQKTQSPSETMIQWARANGEAHFYSLDGDADRVVAFYNEDGNNWRLLDGDRIAILFALVLRHWIGPHALRELDVGVVQTAYANGASTHYLQHELGFHVYSAATGVKNLHPIAHKRDVGVYFEANGHGTVLFKKEIIQSKFPSTHSPSNTSSMQVDAKARAALAALPLLLSQVCGDAIADMLMCEIALLALGMDFTAWHRLYKDLPSLQTKVTVRDPRVITNTPDERRALTPRGLQEAIDVAVSQAGENARAFVRPSGTEPIVRVYAEARDASVCKKLSMEIEELVRRFCDQ